MTHLTLETVKERIRSTDSFRERQALGALRAILAHAADINEVQHAERFPDEDGKACPLCNAVKMAESSWNLDAIYWEED